MILSWGMLGSGLAAEDILFNRLGVQDGLSSNEITCILKDRKGFMWKMRRSVFGWGVYPVSQDIADNNMSSTTIIFLVAINL